MENIYVVYVVWNILVFLLFGLDKLKAVTDSWRISERTLLTSAFLLGAAGAALGMRFFHHKTRKKEFKMYISIAAAFNIVVIWLLKGELL